MKQPSRFEKIALHLVLMFGMLPAGLLLGASPILLIDFLLEEFLSYPSILVVYLSLGATILACHIAVVAVKKNPRPLFPPPPNDWTMDNKERIKRLSQLDEN